MRLISFIRHFVATALVVAGAAAFCGCSLIDEDLSVCEGEVQLEYGLTVETDITTEIETELHLQADVEIQGLVKDYLGGVFTEYARDIDLSFYDTEPPMPVLKHMSETMNDSESSYTLYLPVRPYRHLAVANAAVCGTVALAGMEEIGTARIDQIVADGVAAPQRAGLFAARENFEVLEGKDQHFEVHLGMVNAASALVLDFARATEVQSVTVLLEGLATGLSLSDGEYVFEGTPVFSTDEISTGDGKRRCFASVHFPSAGIGTKADEAEQESYWRWKVYATLKDGSITESIIDNYEPLLAGELKIVTALIKEHGEIGANDTTVGVTVHLDWDRGPDFPVPL